MVARCHRPNSHKYNLYGARGIQVCEEWRLDFWKFFEYIGDRPGDGYSIDRINNDGNYEPGNVRWATVEQQARNKRNVMLVNGMTVQEFAEQSGVPYRTAHRHMKQGYCPWPRRPAKGIQINLEHIK